MDNYNESIDADLYSAEPKIEDVLQETTESVLIDLNQNLTEKVRRRVLKGQIDDDKISN